MMWSQTTQNTLCFVMGLVLMTVIYFVIELPFLLVPPASQVLRNTSTATGDDPPQQTPTPEPPPPLHRRYSRSHCIGHSLTNDTWQYRSCHLESVCYNASSTQVLYFVNPLDDVQQDDLQVSLAPLTAINTLEPWAPELRQSQSLPEQNVTWMDGVSILFQEYNSDNFGHMLFDEVFPWFRLMDSFGFLDEHKSFQPIKSINMNIQWSCDWMGKEFLPGCERMYAKVGGSFAGKSVQVLSKDYVDGMYCFENLLVGVGYLADHGRDPSIHGHNKVKEPELQNVGIAPIYWKFRNEYMRRVGLEPNTHMLQQQQQHMLVADGDANHESFADECTVVLLPKDANDPGFAALAQRLVETEPNLPIQVKININLKDMSMKEQIESVSTANVMVAPCGGSAMIGLFLPRGSTAILLKRGSLSLDAAFWKNLAHVRATYVQWDGWVEQAARRVVRACRRDMRRRV